MSGDSWPVSESALLLPVADVSLSSDPRLNADLSLVAHSATQEFSTLFSLPPPAGIRPVHILYHAELPEIRSAPDISRYIVYLPVTNRHYAQLVYYLGHELCHIFADPRRKNWFVESCCAMASTVLLCRMSRLWSNNPPYPNWRSYAPDFQRYAQKVIRRAKEAEEPDARQGQVLNAQILCPLFNESVENWNALCLLGQASSAPPLDLTDWNPKITGFNFDRWLQAVPGDLKAIVHTISNIPQDRWDYRL